MRIVDGSAILTVLGQEHVLLLHDWYAIDQQFRAASIVGEMLVGIGHIADGWNHHGYFSLFLAHSRDHKEWYVILVALLSGQLNAVRIAFEPIWNDPFEIDVPARIVNIIIKEMN